jgi:hypothetical protein
MSSSKDVKGAGASFISPGWLTALQRNWGDASAAVRPHPLSAPAATCAACRLALRAAAARAAYLPCVAPGARPSGAQKALHVCRSPKSGRTRPALSVHPSAPQGVPRADAKPDDVADLLGAPPARLACPSLSALQRLMQRSAGCFLPRRRRSLSRAFQVVQGVWPRLPAAHGPHQQLPGHLRPRRRQARAARLPCLWQRPSPRGV